MADPRFHERTAPKTVGEIAELSGAELIDSSTSGILIHDVAPLDKAQNDQLSFLDNVKYKDQFRQTSAGACVVANEMAEHAPNGCAVLVSKNPYKAYALTAQAFYPDVIAESSISENAVIHSTASVGEGCVIEAGAVIMANAEVGARCHIGANAVIDKGVVLGGGCRIGANATISHSLIGNNVRVYPGCCIGQDGFGFAIDPAGHVKVPQLGRVVIGDSVEIGANTTIDRGAGPDTEIGQGTWIDNLVQIGHNVRIGRGCVIVSQVGISGSSVLDDFVVIGGQAGVAGHLHVGKGARVAAQSGVMRDIPDGLEVIGAPAMPAKEFMRQVAFLRRLVKKKD